MLYKYYGWSQSQRLIDTYDIETLQRDMNPLLVTVGNLKYICGTKPPILVFATVIDVGVSPIASHRRT
jgi:hypothetical protein